MKHIALVILAVNIYNIDPTLAEINICSNVANAVLLPNLTDCSRYIACLNQVAVHGSCPEDLYFTPKTQVCDVKSKTECVKTCGKELSTFAFDTTCTKFVLCFHGIPIVQSCCDNLQYNALTDRCDFPQNVDCQDNKCSIYTDPDNMIYLASYASCQIYYICHNAEAIKQECADGLAFNMDKKGCDYKANVNCTDPPQTRSMLPYSKVPPTHADIDCPKEGSHFYPHATDPGSYYLCVNGEGVVLTCSPGLVYDDTMESCRELINIKK